MVSSSNGQEAILVGCRENPEKIYKLKWSIHANLEWVLMKQQLKYPRSNAVAMLISDALTYCKGKNRNYRIIESILNTSKLKYLKRC